MSASTWRLRFAVAVTFVTLVFLAGRALAETNADAPTGKADAVIDLATKEGIRTILHAAMPMGRRSIFAQRVDSIGCL